MTAPSDSLEQWGVDLGRLLRAHCSPEDYQPALSRLVALARQCRQVEQCIADYEFGRGYREGHAAGFVAAHDAAATEVANLQARIDALEVRLEVERRRHVAGSVEGESSMGWLAPSSDVRH